MSELILYTTEDGRCQAGQQTVWLMQLGMAELDPAAAVKESLTAQTEGARKVNAEPKSLENTIKKRPKP